MATTAADGTISVLIVRALLAGATALGLSPKALAEQTGLPHETFDPNQLQDADARLPARVALRLWETLPALSGKPHFGLWLAELVRATPLTLSSWFILSSPTVDEGLARAVRFQRILHDHAASELVHTEHATTYIHRVGDASFRAPSPAIEFGFASVLWLIRRATGQPVLPERVQFQHARPREYEPYGALFGENIVFGARTDEIRFSRATLELPVLSADAGLGELVLAHARAVQERLPTAESLSAQVRRLLAARLPETALGIDDIANALVLTKRTLQRRLRDEGTSFDDILDSLRQALAERYLRDQRFGVQQTAFLLGYSDISAFSRAFVRWKGVSPVQYRDQAEN